MGAYPTAKIHGGSRGWQPAGQKQGIALQVVMVNNESSGTVFSLAQISCWKI